MYTFSPNLACNLSLWDGSNCISTDDGLPMMTAQKYCQQHKCSPYLNDNGHYLVSMVY